MFKMNCKILIILYFIDMIDFSQSSVLNSNFYVQDFDDSSTEFEIIYLPALLPKESVSFDESIQDPIYYNLSAFGRSLSLKLQPNYNLIAPNFKVLIHDEDTQRISDTDFSKNCHYLHKDGDFVAAFSLCQPKSVHGLILFGNITLEINPLNPQIESHKKIYEALESETNENFSNDNLSPHVVKRSAFAHQQMEDDLFIPVPESVVLEEDYSDSDNDVYDFYSRKTVSTKSSQKIHIEVAVFFDEAGYRIFAPYLKYDENRMANMLLAYMNGVQALYHHPSIGRTAEIALVRLEIMKKQPSGLPHYDGERSKLLDSFCDYQQRLNPKSDANPEHWDMGLYVSGLDFHAYENGRKSGVTMGLAPVGGVCLDKYNCVIAELGTTNVFGKPYPSAGFTSVYILAHEIGHNLGMNHDSTGNNCPKEGYIMSPSRGTNGETIWSTCSADVMSRLGQVSCLLDKPGTTPPSLNHNKFQDTPGQNFGAKRQCEILLRDKDAVISPNQQLTEICYNLQCKTPKRSGFYHAGPALEGTECGRGKWCQGGNCIKAVKKKPVKVRPGGWSQWNLDKCSSGCLTSSKGFQNRQRECNNPTPLNTDEGCEGNSYEIVLCKDNNICGKRKSPVEFASLKCREFSNLLPELDRQGAGLQAPHETARPWMGCAIFCRRADTGSYYTPRVELNDLKVSPYFPDGTWCHSEGTSNYYCLHHHCLPENFQFTKTSWIHGMGEDIPFSQNANPNPIVPPELHSYLSLSPEGKPLQTSLRPNQIKPPKEEDWETKDYIEIPSHLRPHIINNALEEELDFISE